MGKLYVIEGTDGSGKQTQFELLKEHLKKEGIEYKTVSFPNYDSPSSSLVKMYLSGEFGNDPQKISPYIASNFYAADRYATFQKGLKQYFDDGGIILADRYTTANMVHQSGKIKDEAEREKYLNWLTDLEFGIYGLPVPSKIFFLNMPLKLSEELIKNRKNKYSHNEVKDIHERNEKHLEDSYNAACSLVSKYNWCEIKCANGNEIRTREDIHNEIYKIVIEDIQKK